MIRETLKRGETYELPSSGVSMKPLNSPYGWTLVTHWPFEFVQPDMVVLFEIEGIGQVSHQVKKINRYPSFFARLLGAKKLPPHKWTLSTRGVNPMLSWDPWTVKKSQYVGLVFGTTDGMYPYAEAALKYNEIKDIVELTPNPLNAKFFSKKLIKNTKIA
ncbi:MAG: hypothetical protein AAFX93_19670 [Verrucomicrobiota bacterium]